jgi:uncharacterized protein (TIGR02598 family)
MAFLPQLPGNRHAFSLVEVVMALGLISFVLIGLLGLMSAGLGGIRSASDESSSVMIAKKLVAEIGQNSFDHILTSTFSDRWFDAEGQEVPATDPLVVYRATANTELNTGSPETLAKIVVSVQHHAGVEPPRIWVSYVAKN